MRGKRVNELVAIALLAVLLLPTIVLAGGSEVAITVKGDVVCVGPNGDCATIEEGLEAVSEGGAVNVAAGTYPGEMWDEPIHGGRLLKTLPGESYVGFQENGISIIAAKKGDGTPVIGTALLVDGVEGLPTQKEVVHFDLYLSTTVEVESFTAVVTLPKGALSGFGQDSLVVYWHDGHKWRECSNYTFGNPDCLTIRLNNYTSPSLMWLNGTPFGVGGNPSTARLIVGLIPVAVMMCIVVTAFMALWRRVDIITIAFLLVVAVVFVIVMMRIVERVE